MQHKITLKITLKKNGKISLFACSAWILKIVTKFEKFIKPCKNKEIGKIIDKNDTFEIEIFFMFSSSTIYLKHKDIIKNKLQNAFNNIKLHKKITFIEMAIYHESANKPDFIIDFNNDIVLKNPIKHDLAVKENIVNYYLKIVGKIVNWNIINDQLKIKNKSFGTIIVSYKKNKENNDIITKGCIGRNDIEVIGSINMGSTNFMIASSIKTANDKAEKFNIKINDFQPINIFSRCQK